MALAPHLTVAACQRLHTICYTSAVICNVSCMLSVVGQGALLLPHTFPLGLAPACLDSAL